MPTDIVRDLLVELKNNLELARKREVEDRLNIYNDSWKHILTTEINNQFNKKTRGNVLQMLAYDVNVLKRIVKETSIVYQNDAKRSFITGEGDEAKEDENYNELLKKIPMNLTMQENNRLTNLNNENIVYIVPRNDRIEYDLLTPNLVEVVQSESNSKEIEAIAFTQTFVDTKGETSTNYIYWNIFGQHLKFDAELDPIPIEGNEDDINPYKDPNNKKQTILPFVIFHKDFPINTVWNVTGGGDIVSSTKQVGVLLTYLNYLFKTQSFKQKVFIGINQDEIPKDLVNDPLWSFGISNKEGDVKILDYQVMLDKLWEIIYAKIGAIANNYGMSLDNFKIIGSAQSGYALRIKNLGLEKVVKEQIKMYRWHELELFEKTKIINNQQYSKKQIAEEGTFKIDFAEQTYPESPQDVRDQWTFDIDMGAKSIADYAMFVNPDIKSTEEAVTWIEKNVEINKKIKEETGVTLIDVDKAFAKEETNNSGNNQQN